MSCGYISLVLAYFDQKLNYSVYLKHKKTINIRSARLSLLILKIRFKGENSYMSAFEEILVVSALFRS